MILRLVFQELLIMVVIFPSWTSAVRIRSPAFINLAFSATYAIAPIVRASAGVNLASLSVLLTGMRPTLFPAGTRFPGRNPRSAPPSTEEYHTRSTIPVDMTLLSWAGGIEYRFQLGENRRS